MVTSVLVVDDNEADQFLSEHILLSCDPSLEILSAFDGVEALDMLKSDSCNPDIIFLDINMPRMDGIEFLENYGKLAMETNPMIVMLTSSIREDDQNHCLAYSYVDKCLPKPLTVENLRLCFSEVTQSSNVAVATGNQNVGV